MKVTAESSGQSPWAPTTSSAPSPFCTVISVAPAKWPPSRRATASRSVPLQATITSSGSGNAAGSLAATTREMKSPRPEMRRPSSFSARACSSRRVSTDTSATRAR